MNLQQGSYFEESACRYLEDKGYRIKARNFRSYRGEIDIIAENEGRLCFIEVKGRSSPFKYFPYESVDERKIQKIKKTAMFYLKKTGSFDMHIRYDVLSILKFEEALEFYLLKGAFR